MFANALLVTTSIKQVESVHCVPTVLYQITQEQTALVDIHKRGMKLITRASVWLQA